MSVYLSKGPPKKSLPQPLRFCKILKKGYTLFLLDIFCQENLTSLGGLPLALVKLDWGDLSIQLAARTIVFLVEAFFKMQQA
jgi:hypothetical protein